jgi:hypothetical protein
MLASAPEQFVTLRSAQAEKSTGAKTGALANAGIVVETCNATAKATKADRL